jgi:hypothetical protein
MGSSLPVARPRVFDNSTIASVSRCPRKGYYQYWLNRAPSGTNYAIQFGLGYHKYREILEKLYLKDPNRDDWPMYHAVAYDVAVKGWENPPIGHSKEYLVETRLRTTCDQAFENWKQEKDAGIFNVLFTEQAFELILPNGKRYGGRFDQLLEWHGKLWIRDFKTTSRMGRTYAAQFDPNNQIAGYIWAASELSMRDIEGVMIETIYNTKTKGPEFHPLLSTRSEGHIEQWLETVQDEIGDIEAREERDVWAMRTEACSDYGGCYFRDACQKEYWSSIDDWLLANTTHSVWDFMNPDKEEGVVD